MTLGKIKRYHRSMMNVVKLEHYYYPWDLERAIEEWVHHCNHERYHESLDNVTPLVCAHPLTLVEIGDLNCQYFYQYQSFCYTLELFA